MEKNKKQGGLIAVAVVALVAVLMIAAWFLLKPPAQAGGKTIEVQVVFADQTTRDHTITTDAEYLRGALEQEKMIEGDESQYGLFVKTVDGVTVDDSNQEWWRFTKDGQMLDTGVDSTPIADGDHFEITLTVGY